MKNLNSKVFEIKMQKEGDKQERENDEKALPIPKCNLHPQKLSNNCRFFMFEKFFEFLKRTCKKNKAIIDEIEKKKGEEQQVSIFFSNFFLAKNLNCNDFKEK